MPLDFLLRDFVGEAPALDIKGLEQDSRQVQPGDAFVALAGATHHGLTFASQAQANGCVAILWEPGTATPPAGLTVPTLAVPELGQRVSEIGHRFFRRPSDDLNVIGVTGTNGKSTCVEFLAQAMNASGAVVGTLGTLGSGLVDGPRRELGLTTPDALTVQRELARMRDAGATDVAMEVSSHALDQGRVEAVRFSAALVTNISRDHLDYHGTMDRYVKAKARLLADFGPRFAILNADDERFFDMKNALTTGSDLITYGLKAGEVRVAELNTPPCGLDFQLEVGGEQASIRTGLMGRFNAYNLAATAATVSALTDATVAELAPILARLVPPRGRMSRLGGGEQVLVIIDYAHTPDALAKALAALREHCDGALYCVFGCGGDRDRGKRPQMGAVASAGADHVVVTSDNPRSEDPGKIIDEILAGVSGAAPVTALSDRREAIQFAVAQASSTDAVLVAGKGHETYQETASGRHHFDDFEVVAETLEAQL